MAKDEQQEQELTIEEMERIEQQKQETINEMNNLLEQMDYAGRKVAFEVARKLKELNPTLSMPVYEKYRAMEERADQYRQTINELSK